MFKKVFGVLVVLMSLTVLWIWSNSTNQRHSKYKRCLECANQLDASSLEFQVVKHVCLVDKFSIPLLYRLYPELHSEVLKNIVKRGTGETLDSSGQQVVFNLQGSIHSLTDNPAETITIYFNVYGKPLDCSVDIRYRADSFTIAKHISTVIGAIFDDDYKNVVITDDFGEDGAIFAIARRAQPVQLWVSKSPEGLEAKWQIYYGNSYSVRPLREFDNKEQFLDYVRSLGKLDK